MYKILLFMAVSFMAYKFTSCDGDPHLCRQLVTVNYTERVTRPMEDYGNFSKFFKQLGIPAGKKEVTLTKLEEKKVCCAGFEKSTDGKCVPIPPTTTTIPTSTTETYDLTESTESSSPQSDSSGQGNAPSSLTKFNDNKHSTLVLAVAIGIGALIIVLAFIITLRILQKRRFASDNSISIVKFNSEMQTALL
ncbi:uncharacterized protein LOC26534616 [Drosophila yakuba]|uniref:Uncharacterized protein n=1 Tax=Drosophila yakuba TaxID=7245 RepID=A0A0R1DSQ6_DROYA|nr:uncharacterized protein LOC26534616 [Drosophila yakuba]KRJ98113.1 uncharacterized protein Dyak_GE27435 [Drosophila yakuba]